MAIEFSGTGNLGVAPVLRHVQVGDETRPVTDLRIFFDRRVKQEDGSYEDQGGFWITASVWGWRAEAIAKLLPKGARVYASGRLRQETWQDDGGEQHSRPHLDADYLTVDLVCIEQLTLRSQRAAEEHE